MTEEDAVQMLVTASDGSFELRFDPYTEGMRFEPTHDGLVRLAATLEMMGRARVYMLPSITQSDSTGLPAEYDAKGFVEVAFTLSQLGLGSCPGGDC